MRPGVKGEREGRERERRGDGEGCETDGEEEIRVENSCVLVSMATNSSELSDVADNGRGCGTISGRGSLSDCLQMLLLLLCCFHDDEPRGGGRGLWAWLTGPEVLWSEEMPRDFS